MCSPPTGLHPKVRPRSPDVPHASQCRGGRFIGRNHPGEVFLFAVLVGRVVITSILEQGRVPVLLVAFIFVGCLSCSSSRVCGALESERDSENKHHAHSPVSWGVGPASLLCLLRGRHLRSQFSFCDSASEVCWAMGSSPVAFSSLLLGVMKESFGLSFHFTIVVWFVVVDRLKIV